MRILVLQHVAVEHPGIFRDFFSKDGLRWDTVELDAGERIPDLAPYGLMVAMGGPQDVWQEEEHPWLVAEKAAIRSFVVEMQRPFLGICLGHQLLAEAVGGKVRPAARGEVGVMDIQMTDAGRKDPLFSGLPASLQVLQWHGAEVVQLPSTAVTLAASDACQVQAMRYGRHAYGLQAHVEITAQTVAEWAAIPAYAQSLEAAMGAGAVPRLDRAVRNALPEFAVNARKLYDNFMSVVSAVDAA